MQVANSARSHAKEVGKERGWYLPIHVASKSFDQSFNPEAGIEAEGWLLWTGEVLWLFSRTKWREDVLTYGDSWACAWDLPVEGQ